MLVFKMHNKYQIWLSQCHYNSIPYYTKGKPFRLVTGRLKLDPEFSNLLSSVHSTHKWHPIEQGVRFCFLFCFILFLIDVFMSHTAWNLQWSSEFWTLRNTYLLSHNWLCVCMGNTLFCRHFMNSVI